MRKIAVKITDPSKVVWDSITNYKVINKGMFDANGEKVSSIPLTSIIRSKIREGLLEEVKDEYENKSWEEIKKEAKERGITIRNKTREKLLEELKNLSKKEG